MEYLDLNRGLYIEGNDWCLDHVDYDLFGRFHTEYLSTGEHNEIDHINLHDDFDHEDMRFGYYNNRRMPNVASRPDRIRAIRAGQNVLVDSDERIRGVLYDGMTYRTYAQSICFLGFENDQDFDRAVFLRDIIEKLGGYRGCFTGTVLNSQNDQPVENATIRLAYTDISSLSDCDGRFTLPNIARESFVIDISHPNYINQNGRRFDFDGEDSLDVSFSLNPMNFVGDESTEPKQYKILAAYPNPFNSVTAIEYTVSKRDHVKIFILDNLGRKINTLVDRVQNAGQHQIMWEAGDLVSGTYSIYLQKGNVIEKTEAILIK